MLHQAQGRSPRTLLCQGHAETLCFQDLSFDLLFSVDVIHHVTDPLAYYREANRVLSNNGRICTATDSEWIIKHRQPLSTYFPETIACDLSRYPRIPNLKRLMSSAGFVRLAARTTEYTFATTNIQAYRNKTFSALHLISEKAFRLGIEQMERDLQAGPILCKSRYTLLWGTKP
jgi:ubiquinone/menaquinone biosynthesis C-methylase UbiE